MMTYDFHAFDDGPFLFHHTGFDRNADDNAANATRNVVSWIGFGDPLIGSAIRAFDPTRGSNKLEPLCANLPCRIDLFRSISVVTQF